MRDRSRGGRGFELSLQAGIRPELRPSAPCSPHQSRKMPLEAVRALALEIAMLGANGISPHGRYNLKAMPNRRDIWGDEILAYYYYVTM